VTALDQSLTLPCGATLCNRLAKAAMTEGLADTAGRPTEALERLYGLWSDGGAGLLLTGNVMVDADHLERPGNVIIDREPDADMAAALRRWASASQRAGNATWVQLSHAGRQTQKTVNPRPVAPSTVKLDLPGGQFGTPRALEGEEIEDIVRRFGVAAAAVRAAGFDGVQIHAAHGYLLSQFLSPRANRRTDDWGGSLENRARLLLDVYDTVRAAVGHDYPVAVKLNSADFQRGGFAFEDSLQVAAWLQERGIDLIEISGGSYEQPKLLGLQGIEPEERPNVAQSTLEREAYFVDFALAMHRQVSVPLMVTGGFRTRQAMQHALEAGAADVVGLGRPMCVQADAPARLLAGAEALPRYEDTVQLLPPFLSFLNALKAVRTMSGFATQYWFYAQLDALGRQGAPQPALSAFQAARRVMAQQRAYLSKRARRRE
jgi:2,4-dienoyl-CoA reductase-like NADH-dependent reductase (Old Yellow Enzyme family)